jgi:hypothetical protein
MGPARRTVDPGAFEQRTNSSNWGRFIQTVYSGVNSVYILGLVPQGSY